MITHFEILIDASGSMGYVKGTKFENKYLLPDGKTTRTELVKKILINSIIPKLSFIENLSVSTFWGELELDFLNRKILIANKAKTNPETKLFYTGNYNQNKINWL